MISKNPGPNLRIIGIDEGTEIQTNGMHNIFNEILSEKFPKLRNEIEIQVKDTFCNPK